MEYRYLKSQLKRKSRKTVFGSLENYRTQLRVWAEKSPRGAMLMGLIAQLMVSMVRYDLEPEPVTKKIDGKNVTMMHKPSMDTIIKELRQWTVVLIPTDEFGVNRIYTNESDLTRRISSILEQY